jgi:ribonuclease HI
MLEYDCINNVTEYETLLVGLNLAINRRIRHITVIGDSNLVVSQIILKFSTKNERLRKYIDLVRNTMKHFEEISIEVIPREENHIVYALAVSGSTLQPCEGTLQDLCNMEVVFRPSFPNNMEH